METGVATPSKVAAKVAAKAAVAAAAVAQTSPQPDQPGGSGKKGRRAAAASETCPAAAAGSGAPAPAPKARAKGRGRPKGDPSLQARAEIEAFRLVDSDGSSPAFRRYLGDEWKTKERYLKDLLKNLGTCVESCDEVEVYDVLLLDQKRLPLLVVSAHLRSCCANVF